MMFFVMYIKEKDNITMNGRPFCIKNTKIAGKIEMVAKLLFN
jgi:hypothetical protein